MIVSGFWKVVHANGKLTSLPTTVEAGLGIEYLPGEIVKPQVGPVLAWSDLDAAKNFIAQSTKENQLNLELWEVEGELDQRFLGISHLIAPKYLNRTSAARYWTKLQSFGDATVANPRLDAYLKECKLYRPPGSEEIESTIFLMEYCAKALEWVKLTRRLL